MMDPIEDCKERPPAVVCEVCGQALDGVVALVDHHLVKHLPKQPTVQHCPLCDVPMKPVDMNMPSLMFGNEWWIRGADGVLRLTCADCTTRIKVTIK